MNLINVKAGKGCLVLFFIPFVCIGLISLFYSINKGYQGYASKDWERTSANVEKVDFEIRTSSGRNSGTSYLVNIKYNYLINNKRYTNDRISFGYGANNTDNHSQIYRVLEDAKTIVVYVNPKDPTDAVIVPGINNSILMIFVVSIMWNIAVLFFCAAFLGNGKNKKTVSILFAFTGFIWIIGFVILMTKSFNIQIEKKIEVVEKKEKK